MRIAVLSDMHANLPALEAVLADVRRQQPDRVAVLGDLIYKGPHPAEVVEIIANLDADVVIRGNCEEGLRLGYPQPGFEPRTERDADTVAWTRWTNPFLNRAARDYLSSLPLFAHWPFAGGMDLFHATPTNVFGVVMPTAPDADMLSLVQPDSRLAVCGHVHRAYVRTVRGRTVVNVGSVGQPYDGDPRAAWCMLHIDGDAVGVELRRVVYDVEQVIATAAEREMPSLARYARIMREARWPYRPPPNAGGVGASGSRDSRDSRGSRGSRDSRDSRGSSGGA